MKVHREYRIECGDTKADAIIEAIDETLRAPWTRDHRLEDRMRAMGEDEFACYTRAADDQMPSASIFLDRRDGTLTLSNVVPVDVGTLSVDTYNQLIEDFHAAHVAPLRARFGALDVLMTPGETSLDQMVGPTVAESLRAFSAGANKSTGASHPRDRERWNTFVIAAHEGNARIDPELLVDWLVEDGWPDSVAYDLVVQYEQARSLLDNYARRGAAGSSHAAR